MFQDFFNLNSKLSLKILFYVYFYLIDWRILKYWRILRILRKIMIYKKNRI